MSKRVVYRVRDIVNRGWKCTDPETGKPIDFPTPEAARDHARYLKRWRLVKVTIKAGPLRERIAELETPKRVWLLKPKGDGRFSLPVYSKEEAEEWVRRRWPDGDPGMEMVGPYEAVERIAALEAALQEIHKLATEHREWAIAGRCVTALGPGVPGVSAPEPRHSPSPMPTESPMPAEPPAASVGLGIATRYI